MTARILLITPDSGFGELIDQILTEDGGYRVELVAGGIDALSRAQDEQYTLVILDCAVADMPTTELAAALRDWHPEMRWIVVPPGGDPEEPVPESIQPDALLPKPFYQPQLLDLVAGFLAGTAPDTAGAEPQGRTAPSPEQTDPPSAQIERSSPAGVLDSPPPHGESGSLDPSDPPDQPSFPWLEDVNTAAQYLARLSMETAAVAALITRGEALWAYAGELGQPGGESLAETVGRQWGSQSGSDLARFVTLENGREYMLYATALVDEMVLALVFDSRTPFSKVRVQSGRMARALSADPGEVQTGEGARQDDDASPEPDASGQTPEESRRAGQKGAPSKEAGAPPRDAAQGSPDPAAPEARPAPAAGSPRPSPEAAEEAGSGLELDLADPDETALPEGEAGAAGEAAGDIEEVIPERPAAAPRTGPELALENAFDESIYENRVEDRPDQLPEVDPDLELIEAMDRDDLLLQWLPEDLEDSSALLEEVQETIEPFSIPPDWAPEGNQPPGASSYLEELLEETLPPVGLPETPGAPDSSPKTLDGTPVYPPPESMAETRPTRVPPEDSTAEFHPGSTPFSDISYACVLVPRMLEHLLVSEVAEKLEEWMFQLCVSFDWRLEQLTVNPQHMQWLVHVHSATAPRFMMQIASRITSQRIFEEFPNYRNDNPSGEFWAPGWLVITSEHLPPPAMVDEFIRKTRERQGV